MSTRTCVLNQLSRFVRRDASDDFSFGVKQEGIVDLELSIGDEPVELGKKL
jgi:hypothetical protein